MALSIDMRRARAQKALDDAGYNDPEADAQRKKKKPKDKIEWIRAQESVQTSGGSN